MKRKVFNILVLNFIVVKIAIMKPVPNCDNCDVDDTEVENRTKRFIQEYDYVEYYDDIELEIMAERQNLLSHMIFPPDLKINPTTQNKATVPPDLKINSNTQTLTLNKNHQTNIQLPSESTNVAPEYMMELYNKFSKNHPRHPSSNIVRSFMNINVEGMCFLLLYLVLTIN